MSDIIKSNFVLFSDQKKMIKNIDPNHPKVLQSSVQAVDQNATMHGYDSVHNGDDNEGLDEDSALTDLTQTSASDRDILSNDRFNERFEDGYQVGYTQGYDAGFQDAAEKGYEDGYNQGIEAAQKELNDKIAEIEAELNSEFEQKETALRQDLEEAKRMLEPQMLTVIEGLVGKIIGIESLNKSTILFLIQSGLRELELHGDLIIKVSPEDVDHVIEHKSELIENLSEKIQVEILKDLQLSKNECVIETDMGTIDCSLGVQLEGLMKELRLIRESLINN